MSCNGAGARARLLSGCCTTCFHRTLNFLMPYRLFRAKLYPARAFMRPH
jgi:hypothetical protein